ncbi:MAG: P-loop NTPase fold protein [Mycoplasmoidaceae bacterium]
MSYVSECSYDILIKDDDEELLNASQTFLKNIDNDHKIFLNNYQKDFDKWEIFYKKNSKKVFFLPEFLEKRSPITIINSKWGNGKTFFAEQLGKNIISKKVKTKFTNFIIIDLWNFIDSDDMIKEIFNHLFFILGSTDQKIFEITKDILNKGLKFFLEPSINIVLKTNLKLHKENISLPIEKLKFSETIIVFDNLERMGKKSWEIMKLIQKLSKLKNIVFILTMDADKINDDSNGFENTIEKFIDLPSYNLKLDYSSLLNNIGFKKEISLDIDKLLKIDNKKKQFSIRELKKIMQNDPLLEKYIKMNRLKILFFLKNKIWKIDNSYFFDFCEVDFIKYHSFLFQIISYKNKLNKSSNEIFSNYRDNYYNRIEIDIFFNSLHSNFSKTFQILQKEYKIIFDDNIKFFLKECLNYDDNQFKLFDKNYFKNNFNNYNEKLANLLNLFNEINKEFKIKIKILSDLIESNDLKISKKKKRIEKDEKDINKENESDDTIHKNILILRKSIEYESNEINELQRLNSSKKDEINYYENLLKNLKININEFKSIGEAFKIYDNSFEKIYRKNLKEEYEFEKINSFFWNLDNKDKILLNANSDNFSKEKTLDYFEKNIEKFIKFFENELSKEEILNK